jgi:hypothetical protein
VSPLVLNGGTIGYDDNAFHGILLSEKSEIDEKDERISDRKTLAGSAPHDTHYLGGELG